MLAHQGCALCRLLAIDKPGDKALVPAKDGRRYGFVINSFPDFDGLGFGCGTLIFSPVAL